MLLAVFANAADVSPWKLQINGARVYSEKFLIEQLDLPAEMDVISPERRNFIIKLAKGNLDDFYQSNGYFSVNVSLSMMEEIIDTAKVEHYMFNVHEGERYCFGTAEIELAEGADSLIGTEKFSVPKGGFYDPEYISNDQKAIRDVYQKNGYLHIVIEHREYIDTIGKKVHVRYFVDPKIQVVMGEFKSKTFRSGVMPGQTEPEDGLSDTAWLNRLWEIEQDSIVNERYFFAFRAKLFSTQMFSQVRLEDTLQENGLSDITLTVYERVPGEANYGFFYEQLYGFGITLSSLHRNLFGSFHEAGISAMLAENRQELSLNYAHPMLFGTNVSWISTAIRLDEKIIFNHEKLPVPTKPDSLAERWEVINRANLSFGLSNRIRTRNTLDFRFLRLKGDDDFEDYFKIKGEIGLIFDFTDNSYDPIKGIKFLPSFGAGGELKNESFSKFKNMEKLAEVWNISLEHGYLYVDASTFAYFPISKNLLSAFAFSYGNVFNKAAEDDAQTFYQGGGRTLRGYRFRTVYPYKTVEDAEGTSKLSGLSPQYFRVNEELRIIPPWQTLRNFQLVQFTDWVHINDSDKSFNAAQEMSVGLGLRYKWQFLTIRLDYAAKTEFKDFKPDKFNFSHIVFDLSQAI
ncbi:MAG: BamA/TamA family outer membrane protein [Fibromonadaceae bacterium]|jgi:outer membrane protein assembly factor BamA|nr:BamA/TamA family outer membrane protein [Fibromonadaceae bacterium]